MTAHILHMTTPGKAGSAQKSFSLLYSFLTTLGIRVSPTLQACGDRTALQRAIAQALGERDLLITLGGLDARPEDNLLSILSRGIGRPLVYDEGTLAALERRMHLSRAMLPEPARQAALIPEGSKVYPNPKGLHPGLSLSTGKQAIVVLPHDAGEVQALLDSPLSEFLSAFAGVYLESTSINVFGLGREGLFRKIQDLASRGNPTLTITPRGDHLELAISARASDRLQAKILHNETLNQLRERLGSSIYGTGEVSVVGALATRLRKGGLKVAFGEIGPSRVPTLLQEFTRADDAVAADGGHLLDEEQCADFGVSKKAAREGITSQLSAAQFAAAALEDTSAPLCIVGIHDREGESYVLLSDGKNLMRAPAAPDGSLRLAALTLLKRWLDQDPTLFSSALTLESAVGGKRQFAADPAQKISSSQSTKSAKKQPKGKTGKKGKKGKMSGGSKAALALATLVFVVSVGYIGLQLYDSFANQSLYDKLLAMLGKGQIPEGYPADYDPAFASLYAINPDVKGQLLIDGTGVNYPVVQTRDNSFYLKRDFYKNSSKHGSIYLDYEADAKKPSRNQIIFGHNMKDGQMFGELLQYKTLDYYRAHPTITFNTVYRPGTYKIISVFITSTNPADGDLFDYLNTVNMKKSDEVQQFINNVRDRSLIDMPVDVSNDDSFITLSTCDYTFKDSRFVLVARRVRDGEDGGVNTSGAANNPDPVMPKAWYNQHVNSQTADLSVTHPAGIVTASLLDPVSGNPISLRQVSDHPGAPLLALPQPR